jgi:hypothetical protein
MDSKPLIAVISSKAQSKKKALKSINSFLETYEAANIESTDSGKCDAVPEDIVNKLTIMKSFMEPENSKSVPSSSSKAESKESDHMIKSAKKSPKKDKNLSEKKRKSAPILDKEIPTDHKSKKKKHSNS